MKKTTTALIATFVLFLAASALVVSSSFAFGATGSEDVSLNDDQVIPGNSPHVLPGNSPHVLPGNSPHVIPGNSPHSIVGMSMVIPGNSPH